MSGAPPVSGCGPACLPASSPAAGPVRTALRVLALAAVLTAAVALSTVTRWTAAGLARAALRACGVAVPLWPGPVPIGTLIVANHSSWLDVLALTGLGSGAAPVDMVAKREVAAWPLIGAVAARLGTLFVDRRSPRALPGTVAAAAARLRAGGVVGVFPEATTWCRPGRGRFRRASFQAAIDAGARVVPVTLWFTLADGTPTSVAAFLGDEGVVPAVLRVLRTRGLRLHVIAGTGIPAVGDRRALAVRAEAAVVHEGLAGLGGAGRCAAAAAAAAGSAPGFGAPAFPRTAPMSPVGAWHPNGTPSPPARVLTAASGPPYERRRPGAGEHRRRDRYDHALP